MPTGLRAWVVSAAVVGGSAWGWGGSWVAGQVTPTLGVPALLVPQSTITSSGAGRRTVWALSPQDGTVWENALIGPANSELTTPVKVIESGVGTYYVSDQVRNAIFEYGMDGVQLRTVVNVVQPRGMVLLNNQIHVAVGDNSSSPTTENTIQRFNIDGSPAGLETLPGGGVSPVFARFEVQDPRFRSPWDILVQGERLVVTNFQNTGGGNPVTPDVWSVNLATGESSPLVLDPFGLSGAQQVIGISGGGFAVAGFSNTFSTEFTVNTAGIYLFNADGSQRDYYNLAFGPRGIYQFENGNFIYSTADGIRLFDVVTRDPAGPHIPGTANNQFRLITPGFALTRQVIPEPAGLGWLGVAGVMLVRVRRRDGKTVN